MPFNSHSYYANKYRREALSALEDARNGPPEWSNCTPAEWRTRCVIMARSNWNMFRSHRSLRRMQLDSRAMWRGQMTPTAFMEKWSLTDGR